MTVVEPWAKLKHAQDFEQRRDAVMDLSEQVFGDGQDVRIVLVESRDGQQHETEFTSAAKLRWSARAGTIEPMPRFEVDRAVDAAVAVNVYNRDGLVTSVEFSAPLCALQPGNILTLNGFKIHLSPGAA